MNYVYGTSYKERKPLIYDPSTSPRVCYDGENFFEVSAKDLLTMGYHQSSQSEYVPIELVKGKTFQGCYDDFVKLADNLKKETKGRINLYKTGSVLSQASLLCFFDFMNKDKIVPEPIDEKEAMFIYKTDHGALIYADKYEGEAHEYDVNSMYPSIMKDRYFRVPIKQGVFKKLTNHEFEKMKSKFFEYGIFRARVEGVNGERRSKLFRFNRYDHYTTIDLNLAKHLGFKITIIEDGEDNFLHYGEGACLKGSQVFEDFVDFLYKMRKTTGNKIYKMIINRLWGKLSQHRVKRLDYDLDKDLNYDVPENAIILNQSFKGKNRFLCKYIVPEKLFLYNWARIKPFMLAKGREKLFRIIEGHVDHVHRIHTDGFLSDTKLPIDVGDQIGELKYEGYSERVTIAHVNEIIYWDDIMTNPKELNKFTSTTQSKLMID